MKDAQGTRGAQRRWRPLRLGVEMGQRGKTAWLGFETYIEVGEGRNQRSSLCMGRSMGRMEFKGV